jgi:hypothetical protein
LNLKSRGQPIPEQFADKSLIVKSLTSSDETLRLTAFDCVCFSRKTTDLVDNPTFEYFLIFYRNSRFTRDPSWRQASIAVMKKLFSRLSESCGSKQKRSDDYCRSVGIFLKSLIEVIGADLVLGSHYSSQMFALTVLFWVKNLIGWQPENIEGFNFDESSTVLLPGLISCLREQFDEVKSLALSVISSFPQLNLSREEIEEVTKFCLENSSTTDEKAATTCGFLLRMIVTKSPSPEKLALDLLAKLTKSLENVVKLAEQDFVTTASIGSMFANITSSRSIFEALIDTGYQFNNFDDDLSSSFRHIISATFQACHAAFPITAIDCAAN